MNERIIRIVFLPALLLLFAALPLRADEKKPGPAASSPNQEASTKKDTATKATGPTPEEIIRLAESKLYSPVRNGLKDLFFVKKLAMGNKYQTFWFKAPDKVKGVLGSPEQRRPIPPRYAKLFKRTTEPEQRLPEVMAKRTVWRLLGRPMSCLLPYGTFEIIKRDEKGTQLRFTANKKDPKNLVWTNIDFYLDKDFHLTRVMQKFLADGRIEEYKIKVKPVEKGSDLFVIDTEMVISGNKDWQKTMTSTYVYKKEGDFWLLDRVDMVLENTKENKPYQEQYLNYRVNQGIEDKIFEEE